MSAPTTPLAVESTRTGRLPLSVHQELDAERRWYEPLMFDAFELIWNSYGVASDVGRLADRMVWRTGDVMRVRIVDEAWADGYREEASHFPDVRDETPRKNRFSFERIGRGRALPRHVSPELHEALGEGLKRASRFFRRVLKEYEGRDVCAWFKTGDVGVAKLRAKMAERLSREHPSAPLSVYLNDGESIGDPLADRIAMTFPPTPRTRDEARAVLQGVLDRHPLLNAYGMGFAYRDRGKTLDERKAWHEESRAALLDGEYLEAFMRCCAWLDGAVRTKTPTSAGDSYRVKHVAERATNGYVPNGALIAAAFYKQVPFADGDLESPNMRLALSKRWLEEQDREARRPRDASAAVAG